MVGAKDVSRAVHDQSRVIAAHLVDHGFGPTAAGRSHLEYGSISLAAAGVSCAIEVAARIHDQAVYGIGAVSATRKAVQHAFRPACSRRAKLVDNAISNGAARVCGSVKIPRAVKRDVGVSWIRPVSAASEAVEHRLGPASAAVRGKLKYGPRSQPAAIRGPVQVATMEREPGLWTGAIGNTGEVVKYCFSLSLRRAGDDQQQRGKHSERR